MKTALILYQKNLKDSTLNDLRRDLDYHKIYILTPEQSAAAKHKNIITIGGVSRKDIPAKTKEIFADPVNKNYLLLPYFSGDNNSKYSIAVYNQAFGTRINPQIFRLKNEMNRFLGAEIANKKNCKIGYEELIKTPYDTVAKTIGKSFILKPVNASSSVLNFKISSAEDFERIKTKLTRKYTYLLEEYLGGNLYSVDFFCDGENVFLLCFAREIPFLELIEKFSPKYLAKYKNTLDEDFLHFLPIRYTLDLKKLSKLELDFIGKIGKKLAGIGYRGFIHLEYKVDRPNKKIGFIEWGARPGGKRAEFIKDMYNLHVKNLPYKLLFAKDHSRFHKKHGLYFLKYRNKERNFIGVYTNVFAKTHILNILKKTKGFLNISFERFLREFLWDHWKIKVKAVKFTVKTSSDHYLYPFYQRNDTKFNYTLELDEASFQRFLKKKHAILEKLVFHDYKD